MKIQSKSIRRLGLIASALFLFSCSSTPDAQEGIEEAVEVTEEGLDEYSDEGLESSSVEDEYNDALSDAQDEGENLLESEVASAEESMESASSILDGGEAEEPEEVVEEVVDRSYELDDPVAAEQIASETVAENELDDEVVGSISDVVPENEESYADNAPSGSDMGFSEMTYVVQPGDSLSKISKLVYGTTSRWKEIADANNISGTKIFPGDALSINSEREGYNSAVASLTKQTVTVQKGDTLATIAKQVFGSSAYWKVLYQYNKSKISNPNKIYAGQVLTYYKKAEIQASFSPLLSGAQHTAH